MKKLSVVENWRNKWKIWFSTTLWKSYKNATGASNYKFYVAIKSIVKSFLI